MGNPKKYPEKLDIFYLLNLCTKKNCNDIPIIPLKNFHLFQKNAENHLRP